MWRILSPLWFHSLNNWLARCRKLCRNWNSSRESPSVCWSKIIFVTMKRLSTVLGCRSNPISFRIYRSTCSLIIPFY